MSDLNKIYLTGALNSNPRIRTDRNEKPFVTFILDVSIKKNKKEAYQFSQSYNCVTFDPYCVEILSKVSKKDRLFIEGNLNQQQWSNESGITCSKINLVVHSVYILSKIDNEMNSNHMYYQNYKEEENYNV